MSDINFLTGKKNSRDQEAENKGEEKIIWSEPEHGKAMPQEGGFKDLPFLSKPSQSPKLSPAPKPASDKDKIKKSRREILNLIRQKEISASKKESRRSAEEGFNPGEKKGWRFFPGILEKLKKQPKNHKEILIDYQHVFNREKIKRGLAAEQTASAVATSKPKDAYAKTDNKRPPALADSENKNNLKPDPPLIVKKPALAKPAREPGGGFFSKFLKFIKDNLAARRSRRERLSALKQEQKPVKTDIPEPLHETKPKISPPAALNQINIKKEAETDKEILPKPEPIDKDAEKVLETNLIKGEIITFFDWHKQIANLIKAIVIPAVIVFLAYFGLAYFQNQNQEKIKDQVAKIEKITEQIKQKELGFKEAVAFQDGLKAVSQIFAKHIYWTNFFKFLEDNTIKDVYYKGFSGDTGGNYSLDAVAVKFSDISRQVDVLKANQKVVSVKTAGGSFMSNGAGKNPSVAFDLKLSILKNIFIE
ncbi:MAG: hypothetical protein PHS62_01955 [Patescibacteria group bacterium]|nr:hypothetical protein [Patescibacteria group bacterium]